MNKNEYDVDAIFVEFLKGPLEAIAADYNGESRVILIDALDEVSNDDDSKNELLTCIVDYFDQLPTWLKVCITTRPETKMLTVSRDGDTLSIEGPLKKFNPFVVEPMESENKKDLFTYFEKLLKELLDGVTKHDVDIQAAIGLLIRKSEGYFIVADYAATTLRSLVKKNSELSLHDIEDLPDGMDDFYRKQMQHRLLAAKDESARRRNALARKVLRLMVAAMEPLPLDLLQVLLDCDDDEEFLSTVELLSMLLPVRDDRVEFYHKSFVDWLVDPKKKAGVYHIREQDARDDMAKLCLEVLEKYMEDGVIRTFWSQSMGSKEREGASTLCYLLKYALKHFLGCSKGKQKELRAIARSLALNIDFMLGRASIDDSYEHFEDCSALGQLGEDKLLSLVGRALQLSLSEVSKDIRRLPGQLIGRLLGVLESTAISNKVQSELKQLLLEWKETHYGYPWWCPMNPSWDQADSPCLMVLQGHSSCVIFSVMVSRRHKDSVGFL